MINWRWRKCDIDGLRLQVDIKYLKERFENDRLFVMRNSYTSLDLIYLYKEYIDNLESV